MSREAVSKLVDRWINEPAFRTQMRADLEGTVKRSGVELDADEWAALRNVDWSLSDEQLQARVNWLT
jgi:hypothetical protein